LNRFIKKYLFSSNNDHRSARNSKDTHRDNHREEKPTSQRATVNNGASTAAAATTDRAFKDKHHPLLIAIWNTDRTQTNVEEKLKGLRDLIRKGTSMIEMKFFSKIKSFSLKRSKCKL
jgi:hypothetical protein